jgi:predicted dehydrogenase
MRVGVVGCGYWGAKHVRVLSGLPEVDNVVIIEPDDGRREQLHREHPTTSTARSLTEGLPMVDAVVIATPARTHSTLAHIVLDAGKHALVEKPMATSARDAVSLARLADERGLTLMVGHTFEHHEAVQTLQHIVQSGELGDLRYLTSSRLNLGLYQSDVNVVWDLAPHDVSIMNYLLGEAPRSVNCWGWKNLDHEVEDVAFLDLSYRNGLNALVQVSWLHPTKERLVTAVGADAMAVYDDLAPGHPIRVHNKGASLNGQARSVSYWDGDVRMPLVGQREALVTEDEHFIHCALTGETPRTGARNGLAVTATLEAAQRSLTERRPVDLAEILDDLPASEPSLSGS